MDQEMVGAGLGEVVEIAPPASSGWICRASTLGVKLSTGVSRNSANGACLN
jgi:hypothetical protein